VVIHCPRAGTVRGHRSIRAFVRRNGEWLAGLHARTETVATTASGGRAVLELLAYLTRDGREVAWPVAVVAEAEHERSVQFRTYCSQQPVTGAHHLRPPVLAPESGGPDGVVGRYLAALAAGDADAAVQAFAPEAYLREPDAPEYTHRGSSTAPRPTTACGAPSSTTATAGWPRSATRGGADGLRARHRGAPGRRPPLRRHRDGVELVHVVAGYAGRRVRPTRCAAGTGS
jgi:limonene-1,2-epoxide hydrolase